MHFPFLRRGSGFRRVVVVGVLAACAAHAAAGDAPDVNVDVEPLETVTTGTRLARPARESTHASVVLTGEELRASPRLTPDGWVRLVPSAATFRRSSSLVADPSSQGLNLRGIGPSSVSRGLVLLDGIPLNDGFGGWVYWLSLPRLSMDRIEVSPGGASALYGSSALGGVVQVFTKKASAPVEASAALEGGLPRLWLGAARVGGRVGPISASLEAQRITMLGYPVVVPQQRGDVDVRAASQATSLHGRLDWNVLDSLDLGASLLFFDQNQSGGTQFTRGDVRTGALAVRGEHRTSLGTLEGSVFAKRTEFQQQRARVAPGRDTEALASQQEVPSNETGGTLAEHFRALDFGGEHRTSVGFDFRRVFGRSDETTFPAATTAVLPLRNISGEQRLFGVFAQDLYRPREDVTLQLDVRYDQWRNLKGQNQRRSGTGVASSERFASRTDDAWNPRLGARWQVMPRWAIRGAGYHAFRAPTLNELYRPFQVGTVLTDSNAELAAETLWGAEAGTELTLGKATVLTLTAFHNLLDNPIAVRSLETPTPSGATRRRENLGASRSSGVELSVETRLSRIFSVLASYAFVDSRVTSTDDAALVGKLLPQVARHRAVLTARAETGRWGSFQITAQGTGPQFEDDLNENPMSGFLVVDARYAKRFLEQWEVSVSGENLFDRPYLVGRAGVDTLGAPRMLRAGLAFTWK